MNENKIIKITNSDRFNSFKTMKDFIDEYLLNVFNVKIEVENDVLIEIHNIIYDYCISSSIDPKIFFDEFLLNLLTSTLSNNILSLDKFVSALDYNVNSIDEELKEQIKNINKRR